VVPIGICRRKRSAGHFRGRNFLTAKTQKAREEGKVNDNSECNNNNGERVGIRARAGMRACRKPACADVFIVAVETATPKDESSAGANSFLTDTF